MIKKKSVGANLESLMDMLASDNGVTRQRARRSLLALGKPAVPLLITALRTSELDRIRWEAVKTLEVINDSRVIPVLVTALEDRDPGVAWMAAEGLRKFKTTAWTPLLNLLIKNGADSVLLRNGAHHVLRDQQGGKLDGLLTALRAALESNSLPESAPLAAYRLLKQLKAKA